MHHFIGFEYFSVIFGSFQPGLNGVNMFLNHILHCCVSNLLFPFHEQTVDLLKSIHVTLFTVKLKNLMVHGLRSSKTRKTQGAWLRLFLCFALYILTVQCVHAFTHD